MLGIVSPRLSQVSTISHRFFGRVGGTSPHPWTGLNTSFAVRDSPARVEENLARVRFQIGVGRRSLFTVNQVHGNQVRRILAGDDVDQVAAEAADALFTTEPSVAVGVRTADCVPILMTSADGRCIAAIHAGWRGLAQGVIQSTIDAVDAAGFPARVWTAAVGPCIGAGAFEVGPEVIQSLFESLGIASSSAGAEQEELQATGLVKPGEGDRYHVDLAGWAMRSLLQSGVQNIERLDICTASETDNWFSHRAEKGRTGRQIAVIARTEPPHIDEKTFS